LDFDKWDFLTNELRRREEIIWNKFSKNYYWILGFFRVVKNRHKKGVAFVRLDASKLVTCWKEPQELKDCKGKSDKGLDAGTLGRFQIPKWLKSSVDDFLGMCSHPRDFFWKRTWNLRFFSIFDLLNLVYWANLNDFTNFSLKEREKDLFQTLEPFAFYLLTKFSFFSPLWTIYHKNGLSCPLYFLLFLELLRISMIDEV